MFNIAVAIDGDNNHANHIQDGVREVIVAADLLTSFTTTYGGSVPAP